MTSPLVSVVIPAFNQASYLGMALKSVLDQGHGDFEAIVVDDGSSDETSQVVDRFPDPRVRYLAHPTNLGSSAARNSGLRAAAGEMVAFLDADDLFHPDKLGAHFAFLRDHPEVGASYNARFEIDSAGSYLSIWRPPPSVSPADMVLGFPFNPSDLVLRREWAFRVGLLDDSFTFYGDDLEFVCRLAFAGCRFAGIDRALTYRRYYPGRVVRNVECASDAMVRALESVLSLPSCPGDVRLLRERALANSHLLWSYEAFLAGDAGLGGRLLLKAVELNPAFLEGDGDGFIQFLLHRSTQDGGDHEACLRHVFAQLPREMEWLSPRLDWTVGRGHLIRGSRAALWGRGELAVACMERAAALGAVPDEPLLGFLVDQLLSFQVEMGASAAEGALAALCRHLQGVATASYLRRLRGSYRIAAASDDHRSGRHTAVVAGMLKAITADPSQLRDRRVRRLLLASLPRILGTSRSG